MWPRVTVPWWIAVRSAGGSRKAMSDFPSSLSAEFFPLLLPLSPQRNTIGPVVPGSAENASNRIVTLWSRWRNIFPVVLAVFSCFRQTWRPEQVLDAVPVYLVFSPTHQLPCLSACRIGWWLTPPRDTRCPCTSCPERWSPVSVCTFLRAMDPLKESHLPLLWSWAGFHCWPGPAVGEFPAQNDVNLAPAPSLPQVTSVWLLLHTIIC